MYIFHATSLSLTCLLRNLSIINTYSLDRVLIAFIESFLSAQLMVRNMLIKLMYLLRLDIVHCIELLYLKNNFYNLFEMKLYVSF